jgi:hypothetical protein
MKEILEELKHQRADAEAKLQAIRDGAETARARMRALAEESRRIRETPVAKADFIDFILDEIDRRGKAYPMQLVSHVLSPEKQAGLVKISQIENAAQELRFFFNPLAGEAHGNGKQATDEALYYLFSDTIKRAVKKALEESLTWPFKETIARAYAKARCEAIQAELSELQELLYQFNKAALAFGETISTEY